MIKGQSSFSETEYFKFLLQCSKLLSRRNIPFYFLMHEIYDIPIGEALNEYVCGKIAVISEPNPVYLKGLIGNCRFVIGSRYHALVSALSQGVPAIGTGWSHKYKWLFDDYGLAEYLIDLDTDLAKSEFILDALIDSHESEKVETIIKARSEHQKSLSEEMWGQVRSMIK
jgi:colanic acid/amylovoran biosynthesis protein